jgi:hypothetical protein
MKPIPLTHAAAALTCAGHTPSRPKYAAQRMRHAFSHGKSATLAQIDEQKPWPGTKITVDEPVPPF